MAATKKRWIWALGVVLLAGMVTWASGCLGDRLDSITVGGEERGYLLRVPVGLPAGEAVPLVLVLHQFTDTPVGTERLSGFTELAERERFIVAYPQGIRRGWNADMRESPDDVQFIEALIDEISKQHPVDPNRIYACGLSAGGMMSQWLACSTDRFAAIAAIAGSLTSGAAESCDGGPCPAMLIHGVDDPVVPFAGGETYAGPGMRPVFLSNEAGAAFWAGRNGCVGAPGVEELVPQVADDATRVKKYTYPCSERSEVVRFDIAGGGHTWPGRENWYPAFIVGATSHQLDATAEIWAFFKRHRRGD